jgi:1,4-alpha-glucan branching enzyme
VPRRGYRLGVPNPGRYVERLNSDSVYYGGSGLGNQGAVSSEPHAAHGREHSVSLTVPPLACVVLQPED